MSAAELEAFLEVAFPLAERRVDVASVHHGGVTLRMPFDERSLRPGGTISGPALMALADTAAYLAVLSVIGPVALAVTSNLEISFLRKAAEVAVLADARLLKLGRRLAVCTVEMSAEGDPAPVAFSTVTYAIPGGAR